MSNKVNQTLLRASALLLEACAAMSEESAPESAVVASPAKQARKAPAKKPQKKAAVAKAAPQKAVAKAPKTVAKAQKAPKAEAAPAATKETAKKKPGPKAKAKAAPKAAPAKAVAGDAVPTLTERLKIVMGSDEVGIEEAIKRLKARGKKWVPNSDKLRPYISLALSTHKDDFTRVSRGVYKVQKGKVKKAAAAAPAEVTEPAPAPVPTPAPKVEAKPEKVEKVEKAETKKATKRHSNGASSEDHGELGNVLDNPFTPPSA